MRRATPLLGALLWCVAPLIAQSPATEFAADRPPPVRPAAALLPPIPTTLPAPKERAAVDNDLLIDLPTALRLANAANPTIATAQVRVREALARVDQADTLWLPTLSGGFIYTRHDGITQRQDGTLLTVSRQSYFGGGGASVRVDLGEAYFQPLVARRLAAAEAATAQATTLTALYDVASAYFDLVQAHAQLRINAYILDLDQQILTAAKAGEKQGLLRSTADVNRA